MNLQGSGGQKLEFLKRKEKLVKFTSLLSSIHREYQGLLCGLVCSGCYNEIL